MPRPTPTPRRPPPPAPSAPTRGAPARPPVAPPPVALPLLPPALARRLQGAHSVPAFVAAAAFTLQAAVDASGLAPALPPAGAAAAGAALAALYAATARLAAATAWAPPPAPLTVVVTGASRGLGKALARSLAAAGDTVIMVGRDAPGLAAAAADVRSAAGGGGGRVLTVVADVADTARADALVAAAFDAAGDAGVDVWINNAATVGRAGCAPLAASTPADLAAVVATNLTATLVAARLVGARLAAQPRGGHFFAVVGAGSGGDATPGHAAYGATKAAVAQLTASLAAEARAGGAGGGGATNVGWHTLSPGLLLSPLLLAGTVDAAAVDPTHRARAAAFNVLAVQPEVAAAHLAPRVRSTVAARSAAVRIAYLTPLRAAAKLLAAPFTTAPGPLDPATGAPRWLPEPQRLAAPATRRAVARAAARGRGLGLSFATSAAALFVALCAAYGGGGGV